MEFNSDDDFDELDCKIDNLEDLIKLGKEFETNKKDIKIESPNISSNNLEKKKILEDEHKPKIINGILSNDGTIKFFNHNIQPKIIKKEEHQSEKKIINNSYVINGKKYSINLEILSKLVKPLTKLQSLIGLINIKNAIVEMILYYLQNFETKNNNLLHTVIEGPPGAGKTEVGKILAEIYANMGIIKSNKFKLVKRSDLIGEYVGHTAPKTQKIIDEADGGVLFIDEAYALGNEEKRDSFSKECIDVINQNLTENKRKFICIIAGYPDELDKCFFAYNAGLRRRFPFKFTIQDYTPEELKNIFIKKVNDIKWKLNKEEFDGKKLTEFFTQNKDSFKYFGGDIDNLLLKCKFAHSKRIFGKHPRNRKNITREDLKIGFENFIRNNKKNEVQESIARIYT